MSGNGPCREWTALQCSAFLIIVTLVLGTFCSWPNCSSQQGMWLISFWVDGRAGQKAKINAIWEQLKARDPIVQSKGGQGHVPAFPSQSKSTKPVPVSWSLLWPLSMGCWPFHKDISASINLFYLSASQPSDASIFLCISKEYFCLYHDSWR